MQERAIAILPHDILMTPLLNSRRSPEPHSAVFSPSRRSSGDETLMGDEPEEKAKPVPVRRHTRFRSATVAVDNAAANFARYKRGKDKKGKGKFSFVWPAVATDVGPGLCSIDRVLSINTEMEYIATTLSPMTAGLEGSAQKVAQYGANSIVDGLPELLKVLQDVAAIHPFIQRKTVLRVRL